MVLDDLVKAFYIAKKDLREYYMKPGTISWGLMFPLVFSLAFMLKRGAMSLWLVPGMISLALFFGSTSMSAMSIVFERKIGSFERLLLFPISYMGIAFGKVLSSFILGVISLIPVLVLIEVTVFTPPTDPLLMAISVVIGTFTSSCFGVLLSFLVKDPSQTMNVFNLIRFPMMFLSNVIIPITPQEHLLATLSYLMPLTYITESIRYAYTGTYDLVPPYISYPITLLLGITFLYIASHVIKKSRP